MSICWLVHQFWGDLRGLGTWFPVLELLASSSWLMMIIICVALGAPLIRAGRVGLDVKGVAFLVVALGLGGVLGWAEFRQYTPQYQMQYIMEHVEPGFEAPRQDERRFEVASDWACALACANQVDRALEAAGVLDREAALPDPRLALAQSLERADRAADAKRVWTEAADVARKQAGAEGVCRALADLARAQIQVNRDADALLIAREAHSKAEQASSQPDATFRVSTFVRVLVANGQALTRSRRDTEARQTWAEALRRADEDRPDRLCSLADVALGAASVGEGTIALDAMGRCPKASSTGAFAAGGGLDAVAERATILLLESNEVEAARKLAPTIGRPDHRARSLIAVAGVLENHKRWEDAEPTWKAVEQACVPDKDPEAYARACAAMAEAMDRSPRITGFEDADRPTVAISYWEEAFGAMRRVPESRLNDVRCALVEGLVRSGRTARAIQEASGLAFDEHRSVALGRLSGRTYSFLRF